MSGPPELVCVGHLIREMIRFPDRTEGPYLGSPVAYCSLAAARMGTWTGVVTRHGPDLPPGMLDPFAEAGVDTVGLRASRAPTTTVELRYERDGSKQIHYSTRSAPILPGDVPASYRGCALLYLCTMEEDVPLDALGELAGLGLIAAVDLGGYGGAHMSPATRATLPSPSDHAIRAATHFDVVKASDEDLRLIFGWDDADRAAEALLGAGGGLVVITRGARGALVRTPHTRSAVEAAPATVVDTTGGGDTFMAGFLTEYLRCRDPLRSARWGCATSACVIENGGGASVARMPNREQVLRRYDRAYTH